VDREFYTDYFCILRKKIKNKNVFFFVIAYFKHFYKPKNFKGQTTICEHGHVPSSSTGNTKQPSEHYYLSHATFPFLRDSFLLQAIYLKIWTSISKNTKIICTQQLDEGSDREEKERLCDLYNNVPTRGLLSNYCCYTISQTYDGNQLTVVGFNMRHENVRNAFLN
jgi:hypothetical protein